MPGKAIRNKRGKPIKVSTWLELSKIENENYMIEVDLESYGGYVRSKSNKRDRLYLTTHFFYKNKNNLNDRSMETLLRDRFGFNLEIITH